MKRLTDKILLFLLCFLLFHDIRISTVHILAFLCAVITSCLSSYFLGKKYAGILPCVYFLVSFGVPEFQIFLPVLWYDLAEYPLRENLPVFVLGGLSYLGVFTGRPVSFSMEVLLFAAVGFQLCRRTNVEERAERNLKELRDETTEKSMALERANKDLIEKQNYEISVATLQERNRIAREIHDNVGHLLTRSILQVGALKAINKDETTKAALEDLSGTLNLAMSNIRSSVHDLHDESVDLKTAVQELIQKVSTYQVELDYDMGAEVPKNLKYSFISIIKEALNNISKHSNATKAHITMREQPGFFQLRIDDNGTNVSQELSDGIGLSTMRERVASLGGTIQIDRENGFHIFISVLKEV